MPGKNSAQKRARANERKAQRNKPIRTSVKTEITKARQLIESNELDASQEAVKKAAKALDQAAQKGVIHRNNAARRKSRLTKELNKALAATSAKTTEQP